MRMKGLSMDVTYDPINFCWTVRLSKNYYGKESNRPGVVSDRLKATRDKKKSTGPFDALSNLLLNSAILKGCT